MKIHAKIKLTAKEKISQIDKYIDDDPNNREIMIMNIIWIIKYLFDYGMHQNQNFKFDKNINRIPKIIERQFKHFEHAFICCKHTTIVSCYEILKMRSGIQFLIDSFCENNDELRKKLHQLDNHLIKYSEKWPLVVNNYYKVKKTFEESEDTDDDDYINYEFYYQGESIVNTKGVPESHSWWPEFCRKK
ncbi:hypothetical protein DMUE_0730 [Dictyocoela muelleri]|nr:hypothetical protein DMUE_0730 [Dictyocoela muelleri]